MRKNTTRKSIAFRPKEVEDRKVYGHWEGDLVILTRQRGAALFTLTERKTREEIIIKISNKKTKTIAKALDKFKKNMAKKILRKI